MDGPILSFQIKMRAVEYTLVLFVLSFGNVVVNENIAGRQTASSIGGGGGSSVNFGSEIPIENGRGAAGAETTGRAGSAGVPGSGAAARNESFANFLNDARYGRFGVGSGTSSSGWNFSPFTSRSRIVETKYGRVQGLSITLFPNVHYSGKNNPLKNKIVEVCTKISYKHEVHRRYQHFIHVRWLFCDFLKEHSMNHKLLFFSGVLRNSICLSSNQILSLCPNANSCAMEWC